MQQIGDPRDTRGTRLSAFAGVFAMAALLLAALWFADRGWRFPTVIVASQRAPRTIYAVLVATATVCAAAPLAWRRGLLLAGAAIGYPVILGSWVIPLAGYVGVVCCLVRTRLSVLRQIAIAAAVWAMLPILRGISGAMSRPGAVFLAILWASVIYAALFVIIERRRHPNEASLIADLVYFFALPRIAEPFFQPIGGRYLHQRDTGRPSWQLIARGLALGGYGLVLAGIGHALDAPIPGLAKPAQLACDFVVFYAQAASQIFVAVALFRLLGFDLASGFRAPFLSGSFSEFFRRYNHYVRDAVMALFYFPLLGTLRKALHRRAAVILSSFGSIFIGSYLLNDFLVPVVTAMHTRAALRSATAPAHLAVLGVYWSLIVVPPLLTLPRRADGRPYLPRIAKIVIFNAVFLLIWLQLGWHHQVR